MNSDTPRPPTFDERLDRLTTVVETLAGATVAMNKQIEAHDRQIEALILVVEKNSAQIASTRESIAALERQWQA